MSSAAVEIASNIMATMFYICGSVLIAAFTTIFVGIFVAAFLVAVKKNAKELAENKKD